MYKIAEKYKELSDILASDDGDEGLAEALELAFSDLMDEQAEGAEVAMKFIREQQRYIESVKSEIDHLKSIIDRRSARIDKAKLGVKNSMIATNTKSIETSIGTFSLRAGSKSTKVFDLESLEKMALDSEAIQDAIKVEVVKKPILKEVKRLIEEGAIPESVAAVVTSEKSLQVK